LSLVFLSGTGTKGAIIVTQSFGRLVERQIQKAIAEGQLSGLKGEGKPLPINSSEAFVDVAMAVAGRIMAEAGALPEEFKIKKLLEAAKQNYRDAEGDDAKRLAMALIADLERRYNIAVDARRRFMRS
jgi:hypothetical protein